MRGEGYKLFEGPCKSLAQSHLPRTGQLFGGIGLVSASLP